MNDNGSLYDFVSDDYSAPTQTPHQNREDMSKPYTQSASISKRVSSAPVSKQADHSYYAWNRFIRYGPPHGSFEQAINIEIDRKTLSTENFEQKKSEYIALYKQKLGEA